MIAVMMLTRPDGEDEDEDGYGGGPYDVRNDHVMVVTIMRILVGQVQKGSATIPATLRPPAALYGVDLATAAP
jgi:hypothetical protein